MERDLLNGAVFHVYEDGVMVSAKRVKAFRLVIGRGQLAIIPWLLTVLEDGFLVEVAEFANV